jgi:hypothetical protein
VVRAGELSWRQLERPRQACVEAGSNTSTVTLRVVGGEEKGSLKSETVKYGRESQGTRTRERLLWQGSAAYTKDRPVLSLERAPHKKQDRNSQAVINIWSSAPDGARHQDLLTDWPSVAMWLWLWPRQLVTGSLLSELKPGVRRNTRGLRVKTYCENRRLSLECVMKTGKTGV